jgi:hypothetical protein
MNRLRIIKNPRSKTETNLMFPKNSLTMTFYKVRKKKQLILQKRFYYSWTRQKLENIKFWKLNWILNHFFVCFSLFFNLENLEKNRNEGKEEEEKY